jgi:hypothetical protein
MGYKVVEVGGDSARPPISLDPVYPIDTSNDDALRRRRSEDLARIADESRRYRDDRIRSMRLQNGWPEAGTFQDCFMYPLKSIVWVLVLAWAWSVLIIVGINCLGATGGSLIFLVSFLSVALLIVTGFSHRLFQYAYASSSQGQSEMLTWPRFHLWAEIKAGLIGTVGLLCGPLPVAFLAGFFWLYGGRLETVDRLILIELTVIALTWWLLMVVASHEYGSIHPRSIVRWFEDHGWLQLAVVVGAMIVITIIFVFMLGILSVGRPEGFFVQAIFVPASLVWVFAILFLVLRWLGVRARPRNPAPETTKPQVAPQGY